MNSRNVLIVGGSGGIGSYMVNAFGEAGYDVLFTYNASEEKAREIANTNHAIAFRADSTREGDINLIREKIEQEYGKLNALVYAAGIFEDALITDMSQESWERVIATNLTGAFLYAKSMTELLRASGSGRFVCIGSVMGDMGTYGSCSYASTKAALSGLVKSIALENAKYGVTANVVSFGYIDTGMTRDVPGKVLDSAMKKIPMRRLGDPQNAAQVVVDVCSEHFNYVSGQTIRVNGMLYV